MFKFPNILNYTQDLLIQNHNGERYEVLIPFPDILDDRIISIDSQKVIVTERTLLSITNWQKVKTSLRMAMLDGEELTSKQVRQLQELTNIASQNIIQDYENHNS